MLKSKMLQKNLFEDLQERHQLYVERLSMRVEAPVHEVKAESIKLGWKLSPSQHLLAACVRNCKFKLLLKNYYYYLHNIFT